MINLVINNIAQIRTKNSKFFILICAFILGSLYSLAFAPYNIFIFAFLCLFCFIILVKNSVSFKQSLYIVYCFNLGFCIFNFYWVWFSISYMFNDTLIKILLFIGGSVLYCIFFLPFLFLRTQHKYSIKFVLKILLVFCIHELLKNYLVGGMPWPIASQIWDFSLYMQQGNALFGSIGFSLITWFILSSLFFLLINTTIKNKIYLSLPAVLLFCAVFLFGFWRVNYYNNKNNINVLKSLNVSIVSTAIDQNFKYSNQRINNFYEIVSTVLNSLETTKPVDVVLFPEVVFGFLPNEQEPYLKFFISKIQSQTALLLGSLRQSEDNFYNSMLFIQNNNLVNFYDKRILVPFGEYIPFVKFLPFLKNSLGFESITQGSDQKIFNIKNTYFSNIICFEVAFYNNKLNSNNIDWLFVSSNEAWFNYSNELYQFLSFTKIRAIEGGVYVFKSSNKGFSAIINPLGVVEMQMKAENTSVLNKKIDIYTIKNFNFYITNLAISIIIACYYLVFMLYIFLEKKVSAFLINKQTKK